MSEYITRERALEILNDIGGCGAEPGSYTAGWDEAINAAYEAIQSRRCCAGGACTLDKRASL